MFRNLKIGPKLIIGFVVIASLVGVVGYLGINSINNVDQAFDAVAEETIPKIEALGDLRFAGIKIVAATKGRIAAAAAAAAEIPQEEKEIKEAKELYNNALGRYENLILSVSPDEKDFLEKIRISGEKLQEASEEIIRLSEEQETPEPVALGAKGFEKAAQTFIKDINAAVAHESKEFIERKERADSVISTTTKTTSIVSIVAFIVAILLGLFISRSISKPVTAARNAAVEIARGNMDVEIDTSGGDEIAELSQAIDKMRISLKAVMREYEKRGIKLTKGTKVEKES